MNVEPDRAKAETAATAKPVFDLGNAIFSALSSLASVVGLGVLVVVTVVALLAFDLWRKHREIEAQAFRETYNLALVLGADAGRSLRSVDQLLQAIAQSDPVLTGGDAAQASFEAMATPMLDNLPQIRSILLLDESGQVVATVAAFLNRGANASDAEYFRRVPKGATTEAASFIGSPIRDRGSGAWIVPMSRGIYASGGRLAGVVVTAVDPSFFVHLFDAVEIGRFSAVTLLQRNGTIVARSPGQADFVGKSLAGGELVEKLIPSVDAGSARYRGVLNGRDIVLSYVAMPNTPYVMNVAMDAGELFRSWDGLVAIYAALGLALSGAVVACAWFTRRDQSRRQVMAAAHRVRGIVDAMPSFVALFDFDGRVIEVNRARLEAAGIRRDEVIGKLFWETYWFSHSPAAQADIRTALRRAALGESVRGDFTNRVGDDALITVDETFHAVRGPDGITTHLIGSGFDVTEQRQLEAQLRQSQKMEAMGQFAGGIAHDFNNLLGAIGGFARFLESDLPVETPQRGFAQRILSAANQGRQLVAQILTFSRSANPERKPVDLGAVIQGSLEILSPTISATTRLVLESCPDRVLVRGNESQISQIVVNLCVNAHDALAGRPGEVAIRLSSMHPGDGGYQRNMSVGTLDKQRAYARFDVADTGPGIPQKTIERIFEPFFSTKEYGRGTGLGLAVVHGVVVSHAGACAVESAADRGTCFSIYLPLDVTGTQSPS